MYSIVQLYNQLNELMNKDRDTNLSTFSLTKTGSKFSIRKIFHHKLSCKFSHIVFKFTAKFKMSQWINLLF